MNTNFQCGNRSQVPACICQAECRCTSFAWMKKKITKNQSQGAVQSTDFKPPPLSGAQTFIIILHPFLYSNAL